MKVTMNIDDDLLRRVVQSTGIKSKTGAVDYALREWDRRYRLKALIETNLGLTEKELITAFDPAYDVEAMRAAENPVEYGKGTRPD